MEKVFEGLLSFSITFYNLYKSFFFWEYGDARWLWEFSWKKLTSWYFGLISGTVNVDASPWMRIWEHLHTVPPTGRDAVTMQLDP